MDYAVSNLERENRQKLAGICAQVSIQIQQRLTLTRLAFLATLSMNNAGVSPLT